MVVLVEHNLHLIRATAHQVLVLVNGTLAACATPDAFSELEVVRQAYLGIAPR